MHDGVQIAFPSWNSLKLVTWLFTFNSSLSIFSFLLKREFKTEKKKSSEKRHFSVHRLNILKKMEYLFATAFNQLFTLEREYLHFFFFRSTTFRHETNCQTKIHLFGKADLPTCFKCQKNQQDCEVSWLRTSASRAYRGNCGTRNKQFRDLWETGPRGLFVKSLVCQNLCRIRYTGGETKISSP